MRLIVCGAAGLRLRDEGSDLGADRVGPGVEGVDRGETDDPEAALAGCGGDSLGQLTVEERARKVVALLDADAAEAAREVEQRPVVERGRGRLTLFKHEPGNIR
jgi:hypothetical protein